MTKFFAKLSLLVFILSNTVNGQYTEVINSNRPGSSYSAFSVGKNVIQGEFGLVYERRRHAGLNTKQRQFGADFAVRYGLLFEQLEVIWDGTFITEKFINNAVIPSSSERRSNFTRHNIGAKYLVFDPFIKLRDSINIRSWKANHGLKWKNLIPAVSIYAGANLNLGDNPLLPDDPTISPKVLLATQSHVLPRLVFVTNVMYDKISSDDPVFSYIMTLTHTFYDLKHSMFIEHQGIKSDAYADALFRCGAARLISENLQVDASIGMSTKNTPTRVFGAIGVSYRLDHHSDEMSESQKRRIKLKGVNPFDENNDALDTLSRSERRRLKKEAKSEGRDFPESNDSIVNPFKLDDEDEKLSEKEEKNKRKLEVEARKKTLDSLNKAFEERRNIQTKEILEREAESGGFEDIDESKLSKKQLKELKKARKERAKNEQKALKEEARKIKEEEKRLLEEQKAEDDFFEDTNEEDQDDIEPVEEKPKKKKKEKKKKKKDEEIFDDF